MDGLLEQLIEATENEYASVVKDGAVGDIHSFVDTGSYAMNALISGSIYGGYPVGKVTALAGEESTGKTFAMLSAVKSFLDADDKALVVVFESEGAISKEQCVNRGIDVSRMSIIPVETVEQFKTEAVRLLEAYGKVKNKAPLFMCLDSLGNLSTRKEMADAISGSDKKDMTRAQVTRSVFRTITLKATKYGVPILITNHTYQVVGSYFPTRDMGGGGGLKYAASTIIFLSKAKEKDKDEHIGSKVTMMLKKGRLTREGKKIISRITFDQGLDPYEGLLPLAEKFGVVKKDGKKYAFPAGKVFETALKKEPAKYYTEDVLDAIEKQVGAEFLFGVESPEEEPNANEASEE